MTMIDFTCQINDRWLYKLQPISNAIHDSQKIGLSSKRTYLY